MIAKLLKYWPVTIITLVVVILAVANYTPNTFLTGWDTLHPEFDFTLNFQRLISSVWHSEQGLGAIPGHSQMADLPRLIILWLAHFILPINTLRYFYIFLCLLIGPLGIYYLNSFIWGKNKYSKLISLPVAFFYLFNLSTLQQFYVPFEMFPTQWAFLPWVILLTMICLKSPSKRNLLIFFIINLLATPSAYAAQLWYAFFGVYILFLVINYLINRTKATAKRMLILLILIIAANSFWLIPNLYYIKTNGGTPSQSKTNRLYSEEYSIRNKENGNIKDVALVKGFYFNWEVYDFGQERFVKLANDWNKHLNQPHIQTIGYLYFSLIVLGLIFAFVKRDKQFLSFAPFFFIPFVFLLNNTFPFAQIFSLLQKIPVFDEASRFIFTKLSILLLFGYSLYLAFFLKIVFGLIKKKLFVYLLSLILLALPIIYVSPVFKGELISPKVKINIPGDYFAFWQTMKSLPDGRVLTLPLYNFPGWQYYQWGYQGSGFIWFGLNQPVLDRDFDRWNIDNEEAYREFYYSFYANDIEKIKSTAQKYNIAYFVWDTNIVPPSAKNQDQVVMREDAQKILSRLEQEGYLTTISPSSTIKIYKLTDKKPTLRQIDNQVFPSYQYGFFDQAYRLTGDYIALSNKGNLYFPLANILENNEKINPGILNLTRVENNFKYQLATSITGHAQITTLNSQTRYFNNGEGLKGSYFDLSNLPHSQSYIIAVQSKYSQGLPLRICIKNLFDNTCVVNEQLGKEKQMTWSYYLIPPMGEKYGYGVSIDNVSYSSIKSINEIGEVLVIDFPYQDFAGLYLGSKNEKQAFNGCKAERKNNFNGLLIYKITGDCGQKEILTNNQSYNNGWIAFGQKEGKLKMLEHLLINNWENGWNVENVKGDVYIIFWPQLLEFAGFGLLIATFGYLFSRRN